MATQSFGAPRLPANKSQAVLCPEIRQSTYIVVADVATPKRIDASVKCVWYTRRFGRTVVEFHLEVRSAKRTTDKQRIQSFRVLPIGVSRQTALENTLALLRWRSPKAFSCYLKRAVLRGREHDEEPCGSDGNALAMEKVRRRNTEKSC